MSGGTTGEVGSGDDPTQYPAPASESPHATSAIPQQPQQAWGQQAWSAQPEYQQLYTSGTEQQAPPGYPQQQYPAYGQPYPQPGAAPQYPQQAQQYPQQQYAPSGQYPQQGAYPQQYPQQQYPAYGQPYPQPGQPQPYPAQYPTGEYPAATAKSKLPLWIGLGVVVALVAVAVLGLALGGNFGSKTLDHAAAERGVEQVLTGSYGLSGVQDVVCPSDQKVSEGATFTCSVTVKGQPQQVTVTFTDGDGTYEVSRPTAK